MYLRGEHIFYWYRLIYMETSITVHLYKQSSTVSFLKPAEWCSNWLLLLPYMCCFSNLDTDHSSSTWFNFFYRNSASWIKLHLFCNSWFFFFFNISWWISKMWMFNKKNKVLHECLWIRFFSYLGNIRNCLSHLYCTCANK